MIKKSDVSDFKLAKRNARISNVRYESAKRNKSEYSDVDIERLRLEYEADMDVLKRLNTRLISDINDITDAFVRRLAEDHYIRNEKISVLAIRYGYSSDTIKRYLRKSRCDSNK